MYADLNIGRLLGCRMKNIMCPDCLTFDVCALVIPTFAVLVPPYSSVRHMKGRVRVAGILRLFPTIGAYGREGFGRGFSGDTGLHI